MLPPSLSSFLSFLGPIGGPEIIMIFLVLILLVGPAVVIVGVLLYMDRKKRTSQLSTPPPPLPSTQVRLQELESLKSPGLISKSEYQEKRQQILGGL